MNGLYRFDMEGFRDINLGLHSSWLGPFFEALSYSGLGQIQFALCLLFLFGKTTRRWVWPLLTTILVGGLLVIPLVKSFVERDRPSHLYYAIREEAWLSSSFPSGHTTTSFGLAAMLVLLTRRTRLAWVGWMSLPWAALVGVSRIYRGVHWPTDVIGGLLAGTFTGCLVYLAFSHFGYRFSVAEA